MKPSRIAVTAALVAAGLALFSCTSDEYGVIIRGLTPPESGGGGCSYKVASETDVFQANGIMDVAFPGVQYLVGAQMYNYLQLSTPNVDMMQQSATRTLHLNANDVIPRYAHVRLRQPNETGTGAKFGSYTWTVELGGSIIPAAGGVTSPGEGVVVFDLIPASVMAGALSNAALPVALGDDYVHAVADFYVEFNSASGATVYSSTFSFPLSFCFGCLNGLGWADDTKTTPKSPADCLVGGGSLSWCSPGQDAWVTCKAVTAQ